MAHGPDEAANRRGGEAEELSQSSNSETHSETPGAPAHSPSPAEPKPGAASAAPGDTTASSSPGSSDRPYEKPASESGPNDGGMPLPYDNSNPYHSDYHHPEPSNEYASLDSSSSYHSGETTESHASTESSSDSSPSSSETSLVTYEGGGGHDGGSDSPGGSHGDDDDGGGPVKSFFEHLEDLRWVLVKSAVALGISIMICLIAGNWLVGVIKWPLRMTKMPMPSVPQRISFGVGTNSLGTISLQTNRWGPLDFGTNRNVVLELTPVSVGSNQILALQWNQSQKSHERTLEESIQLLNLNPAGGFFVAFQVAIYGGIVLASPFILYYLADFIFPALRRIEKRYVKRGAALGLALFFMGVLFCYFVLMPLALRASVVYSEWLGFSANQWRAEEYISFVCKFMVGMGLGFELPIVVLTLVRIGLLNYEQLAGFRKYMVVINLVLGAVLTTPEVLTQLMMALPLQVLYEISVWIAWYWERRDRKRAEQEEANNA